MDSVENVPIGTVTPNTGSFTTLGATGNVALGTSSDDSVIVSGTLHIASGSPGAGKMLVSDASGNAAWQTISAPGLPNRVLQVGEGAQYATIQAAQDAIVDNDADHQYVIKIAPGVYEEAVELKAYVSLVGSGRENTLIRVPAGSASAAVILLDYTGVVGGSGHNTIRDLSLAHLGSDPASTKGIDLHYATGVRVANVTITNVGGEVFADGIICAYSDVALESVSVRVSSSPTSTGVMLYYSSLVADRLEAIVNDMDGNQQHNTGISLESSNMWLRNSSVGATGGDHNYGIQFYTFVAGEEFDLIVHSTRLAVADGFAWSQSEGEGNVLTANLFNSLLQGQILAPTGVFQLFGCTDGAGNVLRTGNVPAPGTAQKEDNLLHVLTVGVGGEYATITAALDAIRDNSMQNRYVIKVGPGVYTERVLMKAYVDLVGSGIGTTTVEETLTDVRHSILSLASYSTVRGLSFTQARGAHMSYAVRANATTNCALEQVSITVTGDAAITGVNVSNGELVCRDVQVRVPDDHTSYSFFTQSSSEDSPTSLRLLHCLTVGPYALYVNSDWCSIAMSNCDFGGELKNYSGSLTVKSCDIGGNVLNSSNGRALLVGCDLAGDLVNIEGAPGGESLLEFRGGSLEGKIRGYGLSRTLVSFSKVVLTDVVSMDADTVIKFFHCHDADLNEVPAPARR